MFKSASVEEKKAFFLVILIIGLAITIALNWVKFGFSYLYENKGMFITVLFCLFGIVFAVWQIFILLKRKNKEVCYEKR